MSKGLIKYITSEDRVVFRNGLQRKLLELARNRSGYTSWKDFSKNVFNVTKRMVFNYLNETSKLPITQVQKLSDICEIPINEILKNWAVKILKKEDLLSEQRRMGGKRAIPLLQRHNSIKKHEQKKKRQIKKLSREELNEIAKKNLMKRDVKLSSIKSLISQEPTLQERELIKENISNNLRFNFQKILSKSEEWRCFDFVYFLNSKPVIAEEATSTNYFHKGQILDFIEKSKWLKKEFNLPLIITFRNTPKRLDMLLLLIEENIIPVFDLNDRIKIITSYLSNESAVIKDYIERLEMSTKKRINESSKRLLIVAERESSIVRNNLERVIQEKLTNLRLNPLGKKSSSNRI